MLVEIPGEWIKDGLQADGSYSTGPYSTVGATVHCMSLFTACLCSLHGKDVNSLREYLGDVSHIRRIP
jgi:hypothetical protein